MRLIRQDKLANLKFSQSGQSAAGWYDSVEDLGSTNEEPGQAGRGSSGPSLRCSGGRHVEDAAPGQRLVLDLHKSIVVMVQPISSTEYSALDSDGYSFVLALSGVDS
jgi:hypothetical protein